MTWGAPFRNGRTVVALEPTWTTDRYGNSRPGDPWTEHTICGVAVAPRRSPEDHTSGAQTVIVGKTIYIPAAAGPTVGPHWRFRIDGELFEVDGEPGPWESPFTGTAPGIEVPLKRVEG